MWRGRGRLVHPTLPGLQTGRGGRGVGREDPRHHWSSAQRDLVLQLVLGLGDFPCLDGLVPAQDLVEHGVVRLEALGRPVGAASVQRDELETP